jgi:hypothetical protein
MPVFTHEYYVTRGQEVYRAILVFVIVYSLFIILFFFYTELEKEVISNMPR